MTELRFQASPLRSDTRLLSAITSWSTGWIRRKLRCIRCRQWRRLWRQRPGGL